MADVQALNGQALVAMVVNGVPIVIQVDGDNAPLTAGNFVELVDRDFYDGISFHRVVREPNPFVVQAGDPNSLDPTFPEDLLGGGGFVDPDTGEVRNIPLEIKPEGATEPIYSQTFQQAGMTLPPALPNVQGTIAMARSDAPDSASSQFYINLVNNPNLDGNYAVFGGLVQGFDVVDQIQQGDRIQDAEVIDGILPTRVSSLIADPALLNRFINRINVTSLPLSFAFPQEIDADNVIEIPQDISLQNPRGILAGAGNDLITGSPVSDAINGNQGNDTISGVGGDDYLFGGRDDDLLNGNEGNDIINGNRGNDVVFGGVGNDFIRGGQDNDNLSGDAGDDYLIGDGGTDTLTGGEGADTFILGGAETSAELADRILDFNPAEGDRIAVVEAIDPATLVLNVAGTGTQIQLPGGGILGVVENTQPDAVRGAIFALSGEDLALTIG
jgi:peptidyl-prolyl cis-trans isomerase B (cyclophilin B)